MLIVNRKYFSPIEMASSYTLPAESLLFVNQQEASSKKLAAKIVRYSISLAMVLFFSINTVAQIIGQFDTVRTAELDTLPAFKGKKVVTIESYAKRFDPRKALLYSAVFPGAGQAYNNSYWKLPIIYGGFLGSIYVIRFYQGEYVRYKNLLFNKLNDPTIKTNYTEDQLRAYINTNRRQRDYFCALTGLWYILQIVDAHVEAHLKEFELNPQLQVSVEPSMDRNPLIGRSTGLSLKFRF